jgi:hypothetical protein
MFGENGNKIIKEERPGRCKKITDYLGVVLESADHDKITGEKNQRDSSGYYQGTRYFNGR